MLAVLDKGQNLRDRWVLARERPHSLQPFGENARAVKQFLVERAQGRQTLAREFPSFHADDVEALQRRILAVDEPERNDVAAHAADAADHHLRPDPRVLVDGGESADEDVIADLAVAAE